MLYAKVTYQNYSKTESEVRADLKVGVVKSQVHRINYKDTKSKLIFPSPQLFCIPITYNNVGVVDYFNQPKF